MSGTTALPETRTVRHFWPALVTLSFPGPPERAAAWMTTFGERRETVASRRPEIT